MLRMIIKPTIEKLRWGLTLWTDRAAYNSARSGTPSSSPFSILGPFAVFPNEAMIMVSPIRGGRVGRPSALIWTKYLTPFAVAKPKPLSSFH